MKIGVDATALVARPTGIGNYTHRLLEPMCRQHPDAQFILFSNEEIAFPKLPNVRHRVSRPKRRGPYWQNTHLRRMLAEERPDVFWGANALLPALRPAGMATLVTVHDLVYKFAPETMPFLSLWGRRLCQAMAVRVADRVVAISQATAQDAAAEYGRPPDALIPPLPDARLHRPPPEALAAVRAKLGLAGPYLLALGTLEPRKNFARLVEAYLNRRAAGVALPTLALGGGKGWLDSAIAGRIAQGEALGFVRRLGYVELADLPALFAAAEAFLMPSIYEGFGMPLLEAQLCGAAVIHGPHASMHEAAGGLGAETPIDTPGLEAMLDAYEAGRLPLACRLPTDIMNDASAASERLWDLLIAAFDSRRRTAR